MSKTLSVLILENFVINEGPKWDKFKKGMKKVGRGAVTAATIGSIALGGGGLKKISDANRNYVSGMNKNIVDSNIKKNELFKKMKYDFDNIRADENLTHETKNSLVDQLKKNYRRDLETNKRNKENKDTQTANIRDNQHAQGKQALVGAAGLGVVPLVAGAHALRDRGEKKKQAKKSLKERLELVKSGMYLNEGAKISNIKLIDGEEPELISMYSSWPGNKQEEEFFKSFYVLGDIYIGEGLVDYPLIKEKKTGHIYYLDLDSLKFDRSSITKVGNSINELKKDKKKKQEKKSLKERLELVKSGMFLNEEEADITALRNKINQGLTILPGLKGPAADKMEDSIRGWEDQINELENKE